MSGQMKILITDDDPTILFLMSSILKGAGYEVVEASTGMGCLEAMRAHHPDLILLDVMLPDISGLKVLSTIKADPDFSHTLVILESGIQTSSDYQAGGLDSGADGYLVKPIENKELLARVRAMERIRQAEEALRENERKYRELADLLPETIVEFDARGRLTFANKKGFSTFGFTGGDVAKGVTVFETIASDDHGRAGEAVRRIIEGEGGSGDEYTMVRRDGSTFPAFVHGGVIRRGNAFAGLRAIVIDISARKQAEEALRASEDRFRSLVETTPDWIWETDEKGLFTYASPAVTNLLGFSPEEVIGKSPLDFMPAEEARRLAPELNGRAARREPFVGMENWNQHKEGRLVLLQTSGLPIFDKNGMWRGYRGIDRDITSHKLAENMVRESEERLRLTLEATNDGVWDWNVATGRAVFSPHYYTMLGYEPYEFPETYEAWRSLVHPEDVGRVEREIRQHIETGEGYAIEARMRAKSGEWKWILTRGKVVDRDALGRALRMVGAHSDITSRRIAEDALKASLKEKEILLKEIHHRVKNNLQIMSSLLNLQSEHLDDPKALDIFKMSMDRVRTMALIHDKLYRSEDLSHIYFPGYVNDLAAHLFETYSLGKGIGLTLDIQPVSFDIDTAIPLGLIINELISNSLKHGFPGEDEGAISMHLSVNGVRAELIVSDTGVGFPEDLDFMDTPSMGMQLVVTLVEQLEGAIELNRTKGTEFRITFDRTD